MRQNCGPWSQCDAPAPPCLTLPAAVFPCQQLRAGKSVGLWRYGSSLRLLLSFLPCKPVHVGGWREHCGVVRPRVDWGSAFKHPKGCIAECSLVDSSLMDLSGFGLWCTVVTHVIHFPISMCESEENEGKEKRKTKGKESRDPDPAAFAVFSQVNPFRVS